MSILPSISLEQLNRQEALRYLGYGNQTADEKTFAMMDQCEGMLQKTAIPRYLYKPFPFREEKQRIVIPETELVLEGSSICEHVKGCEFLVLMCATLSAAVDKLIRTVEISDMATAVILDSMANTAIEQIADKVDAIIWAQYPNYYQTFRFGIGYGDLPIETQGKFLDVLNAPKQIGLCVSESNTLTPGKSVTGIIGMSKEPVSTKRKGCASCQLRDICAYRKTGSRCTY